MILGCRSVVSLCVLLAAGCSPLAPEVAEDSGGSSGPPLDGSSSGTSGLPPVTSGVMTGAIDGTGETTDEPVDSTGVVEESTGPGPTSEGSTTNEPATTTGESMGSSGGAVCGDGSMDPAEACDDGDEDDLDGCLNDCRLGPTSITYGAANPLTQHGNTMGGTPFDDQCPAGEVLIGLRGTSGGSVDQIQGVCGALELVDPGDIALSLTESTILPVRGMTLGMPYDQTCPAGSAVVGFGGRSGALVDAIVLRCAPIVLADDGVMHSLELGMQADLPLIGNPAGGRMFPQTDCAAGEVATEVDIRAGNSVDAFGMTCRSISLVY